MEKYGTIRPTSIPADAVRDDSGMHGEIQRGDSVPLEDSLGYPIFTLVIPQNYLTALDAHKIDWQEFQNCRIVIDTVHHDPDYSGFYAILPRRGSHFQLMTNTYDILREAKKRGDIIGPAVIFHKGSHLFGGSDNISCVNNLGIFGLWQPRELQEPKS